MSSLPPLSQASIVVGFVSFAFTVLTWLNIFWSAFGTISKAPREITDAFDNLRQELYEEKQCLKKARKHEKGGVSGKEKGRTLHVEAGPMKVLNDTVKHLVSDFKRLERPFLREPRTGKDMAFDPLDGTYKAEYADMDFSHRFIWLKSKADVRELADRLLRLQIRRIAREVNEVQSETERVENTLRDCDDRLWNVEERLKGRR